MAKLEFTDEASRMVEAINLVPDTIGRRQAIMRALNLKTGERVLDVGSGPGHQALEMSPMVGGIREGGWCRCEREHASDRPRAL